MAQRNYSSSAAPTTLSLPIVTGDTSISVVGLPNYPQPPFTAAIDRGTTTEECVLVTGVSGTTLTVTRGYDNTAAQPHSSGAQFEHCVAAIDFREANQHLNAAAGVHGLTGNVVGDSDTQTLSNKTLAVPTIGDFTNAVHDHSNTTNGGPALPSFPYTSTNHTVAQSVPNTTDTAVSMGSKVRDNTGGGIWTSANPTRFYATQNGIWMGIGNLRWTTNTTGPERALWVRKNGSVRVGTGNADAAVTLNLNVIGWDYCVAGDYFEFMAWQNSGGPVSTQTSLSNPFVMQMISRP